MLTGLQPHAEGGQPRGAILALENSVKSREQSWELQPFCLTQFQSTQAMKYRNFTEK